MISVIVPVYKVEQYLDKCVQSIVDQTYRDLEIILVDDGSPDRCGQMCDAWAEKDSRIRVIHKENGGLSDARNAGMALATGEYIGFVDSDDWLAPDFYRVLIQTMAENHCDIVSCRFLPTTDPVPTLPVSNTLAIQYLDTQESLAELIRDGKLQQVVWNKLYRREIVCDTPFAVGKCHEDEFWSYQVIGQSQKIAIVDYLGYYYFQRPGSIMRQGFSSKRLDAIEAKCLRQQYLQEFFPMLADMGLSSLHFECIYFGQQAIRSLPASQSRSILQKLAVTMIQYPLAKNALRSKKLTHRLWLTMARFSLPITCLIRNLLKIGF